jgi:hypothetical protein
MAEDDITFLFRGAPSMTARGQKPKLPRCNINARFTSVSGHYAGDLPALPTRLGRHAAATLALAKGRLTN